MKFSDLDKQLTTEAEAFDKTQGRLARAGTKLKSKLGPTKGMRQRATGKAQIQQQALDIKGEYMEYVGANDLDMTAGTLKQFFADNNYENLAAKVDEIAVKLEFKDPEVEKPKAQPADSEKAEEVSGDEEQEDMVSPEEMTGEKSSDTSDEEIQAGYDKIAADAEAEAKELGAEDDEVEEEVDMSASIYESRLAYLLIEDKKLKDNQLDTLLVRVLQAAGAGGKKATTGEEDKEPESKKKEKKLPGKMRQKISDIAFGDASKAWRDRQERKAGAGDDGDISVGSTSGDGGELNSRQSKLVKDILKTILSGKELSKEQTTTAKDLLRDL